ncbi:putative quinol monooxygenase [Planctomicrobium sp. SH664]|uniref:putative quinol monooxygenase n=1 Tax=Planctomicrobium sp. SH664 TaxID=3448125 RepID=UPI003F5B6808
MLVVTVEFRVQPGQIETFRREVCAHAQRSLTRETGCRQFDVCWREEEPDKVFLYEKYDDQAAFDAHCESEHLKYFASLAPQWVAERDLRIWSTIEG